MSLRLDAWAKRAGLDDPGLCRAANIHRSTLFRWRRGRHWPTLRKMLELEKLTEGQVRVHHWYQPRSLSEKAADLQDAVS